MADFVISRNKGDGSSIISAHSIKALEFTDPGRPYQHFTDPSLAEGFIKTVKAHGMICADLSAWSSGRAME